MSIHISAKAGEIASTVLMPGDPLRAKFIANTFLEDVICFNKVRGMLGFPAITVRNRSQSWAAVWVFRP